MADFEEIDKAQDLLREKRVSKLNLDHTEFDQFFVVTGSQEDYLVVLPNFCTCTHFQINCIKVKDKTCKHILAATMASNKIRQITMDNWQELLFR